MPRRLCLLPIAWVVITASIAATTGDSPGKGGAGPTFKVPSGFTVEKVAGFPLVRYPLFAALDDQGRLYVAEGTGTNLPGDELAKKKLGRIVVLEDTDGDGKFDTSKVFADDLVFPQGVLWHDGAVYAASHPSFWKFEDTKGQGAADRREELLTGFKFNGNGCDIHGPFLGPDGRLYWTDGRHGYKCKTKDGEQLEGLASRIWRCRPDGTDVERLAGGGFDNPVQIAFTPEGDAIGTMDQGPGDALLHYIEGGVYPMEHPCLKEFPWTGPLLGSVQQYSPAVPAALCGFTAYRSRVFGNPYQNTFFSTHYMLHKIVQNRLIRDGSTFRAEDRDFLTSTDPNVHLTDVIEDADGSLLFVDMGAWFTYGFPGNPLPRPDVKGAIYRIRRTDAPAVKDPWGKALGIGKLSPVELTRLLDDPRPRVRDQVLARLGRIGPDAVPALEKALRSDSIDARRNAVWALCRIRGPEARAAVRLALNDKETSVRLAAIHAAGLDRDEQAYRPLMKLLASGEMPERCKAAESLGRIGRPEAVLALLEALARKNDRFLEHSLTYALIQIGNRSETVHALEHPSPRVRLAGLIALEQMPGGKPTREMVVPLLETDDEGLQQTVLEVVNRRPEWGVALVKLFKNWLDDGKFSAARERSLRSTLFALREDATMQALMASTLIRDTPTESRLLALRVLAQIDPQAARFPGAALIPALNDSNLEIRRAAIAVAKATRSKVDAELQKIGSDIKLPIDVRIAAWECLAERQPLDGDAVDLLREHLGDKTDPLVRLAAARTLGAAKLSDEQLQRVANKVPDVSAMVLRQLLPAFGQSKSAEVGKALAAALDKNAAAEAIHLAELDRAFKKQPAEVVKLTEPLRKKLAARVQNQAAYLAGIKKELAALKPNPNLGRFVFESQKAACATCHRASGKGGQIGPDLSQIGVFRSRDDILESIVFPSLTIAPEYRTFQVQTKDGKATTGLIIWETPDTVTLRTAQLTEVRIARKDIEELSPATVSLMPDGLERTLNRQELCDLVEFLVQRK